MWLEDQRLGALAVDLVAHIAVQAELDGPVAVSANRLDFNFYEFAA
jgi:hypothetical protein